MKQLATSIALLGFFPLVSACVDIEDDAALATESVSQEVISSELLSRGYGWGGQATGGAGGFHYVVTSTADDGSCGTLRYGVGLPGAKWITFDPQVFPASTKRSIWLASPLQVPSDTTIDGRGSWVSLRRAYRDDNVWWKLHGDPQTGTYECNMIEGADNKGPVVDIRGATNVILTNLDFYKTYPLGTVYYDDGDTDEIADDGWKNLDTVSAEQIDAQCYDDVVAIQFGSSEVWIDHSDFTHCGDECISVRAPNGDTASEVTISNNYFVNAWKAILLGAPKDMGAPDRMRILASVYQNRFVGVKYRQPRVEAAAAHIYNNLYEDWHGTAIHAHATASQELYEDRPDITAVRTRAMVEHNVFRAVTQTTGTTDVIHQAVRSVPIAVDAVLWSRSNRCTSNTTCANTSSFPSCSSPPWYFRCDAEHRGNLIQFSSSTSYSTAYNTLRPLAGSSRTTTNDVRNYPAYSCELENAPPF